MVSCCVPYCKSSTKKGSRFKRKVYEFPSNAETREKWVKNISRKADDGKELWHPGPSGRDVVCELHFTEDDFKPGLKIRRLKAGAVPSIFPGYPSYKQQTKKCRSPPKKRTLQNDAPQRKQRNTRAAVINEDITEEAQTTFLDNLLKNVGGEKAKFGPVLRRCDELSKLSQDANNTKCIISDAGNKNNIATDSQLANVINATEVNSKSATLSSKRSVEEKASNAPTEGQVANVGRIIKVITLPNKHKKATAMNESSVITEEEEAAENLCSNDINSKNTVLSTKICDDSVNNVAIEQKAAILDKTNEVTSKSNASTKRKICNAASDTTPKRTRIQCDKKTSSLLHDALMGKGGLSIPEVLSHINQGCSKTTPLLTKYIIVDATGTKNIVNTNLQATNLSNVNKRNSNASPLLVKSKCRTDEASESKGQTTNKENYKNILLLIQRKIHGTGSKDSITTKEQAVDLGNKTNSNTSLVKPDIQHHTTTDEDTVVTEGNNPSLNKLDGKTNGDCTTVNEQVTNANISDENFHSAPLLAEHDFCSAVTDDNVTTDEQAMVTSNNNEISKNTPLLDTHNTFDDNIEAEQATNVVSNQENSENTPPCISLEKQTSPEKLLVKSNSQISILNQKIQKLEHLLQLKENALNDQLTRNILCIKSKSEEGDKSALFLLELLNNYGKVRRQWSDVTIRNCLIWRRYYAKGYEFARQNGLLHLPSKSTLKKFMKSTMEQNRTSLVEEQNDMGQNEKSCEKSTSVVEKSS